MTKYRVNARVDDNQNEIINGLRERMISVSPRHDDIFVGYRGKNYWFEIKNPARCFKADGVTMKPEMIKPSQEALRNEWRGHYSLVTTIEEILDQIGF